MRSETVCTISIEPNIGPPTKTPYKIIGIPPLAKGKILIKLLFKITYNGILNISIIGFKNPFDDNSNSFDYKFNNNIKLISSYMAKDLLKKILNFKK